jgi:lysophospholipase L1-like esterase
LRRFGGRITSTAIRLFFRRQFISLAGMKKFLPLLLPLFFASACLSQETNKPAKNPAIVPATRSTPTNWLSRHEGFVKQARAGGIDLLFMGDSITDNWRGSRGKAIWDKYYGNRHAANFGIGGDRTQHVLWRIENGELDGIDPKVIVLMIGTNNSNTESGDQIAEGVEKIVSDMRTKCPKSKILLLAIFPRNRATDKPEQMERIHRANERIAKLSDGQMVTFLDIDHVFLGPDGKVPADIMPDFLHPNERGYQLWADAMEPTLDKMLK